MFAETKVLAFDTYSAVDLGIWVDNGISKYYFIKLSVKEQNRRKVYLMAVEDENYTRWAKCLKLESDCLFRDSLLKEAEDSILTKHLK